MRALVKFVGAQIEADLDDLCREGQRGREIGAILLTSSSMMA